MQLIIVRHIREQTSAGPAVLSQNDASHLNPAAVFPREFPAFVHVNAALLLLAMAVHTAVGAGGCEFYRCVRKIGFCESAYTTEEPLTLRVFV